MTGGCGGDGSTEVVGQKWYVGGIGEAGIVDVRRPSVRTTVNEGVCANQVLDGRTKTVAVRVVSRDRPGWNPLVRVRPSGAVVCDICYTVGVVVAAVADADGVVDVHYVLAAEAGKAASRGAGAGGRGVGEHHVVTR